MFRTSGYFFAGSKSGGFWIQAWIVMPSKLGYVISSGGVRLREENSASLKRVTCRRVPVAGTPAASGTAGRRG